VAVPCAARGSSSGCGPCLTFYDAWAPIPLCLISATILLLISDMYKYMWEGTGACWVPFSLQMMAVYTVVGSCRSSSPRRDGLLDTAAPGSSTSPLTEVRVGCPHSGSEWQESPLVEGQPSSLLG